MKSSLLGYVLIIGAWLILPATSQSAYYSVAGSALFPTSGSTWNTAPDGSGAAGLSTTYNNGTNDLTLQSGSEIYSANTADLTWNARSYTLAGAVLKGGGKTGTFNGGDITVASAGGTFTAAKNGGAGVSIGGVNGASRLLLGGNTLNLTSAFSSASGIYDFGLQVVGSGNIDFGNSNSNVTWLLSNLSSGFTGNVLADRFLGVVRFSAGTGAAKAGLILAADAAAKGRLDVNGPFSLGLLAIEGVVVPSGIYTYADLVAVGTAQSKSFADNLVNNGGTVYVGLDMNALYYSVAGSALFPTSGSTWNKAPDGSGAAGLSTTYNIGTNDLVLQSGTEIYSANTADITWNARSYILDGAILRGGGKTGTFNGGDITVASAGGTFSAAKNGGAGVSIGGVNGAGRLLLGCNTLNLTSAFSSASGIYDFGLQVIGDGYVDFGNSNSNVTWLLSNLSSGFAGTILADRFQGIVKFSAGAGASKAGLILAVDAAAKGRLDVNGAFSLGQLTIEGVAVSNGVYSYSNLVAVGTANSKNFADNLINNGGKIYVGLHMEVVSSVLNADWESGSWDSGLNPAPVLSFQDEDGLLTETPDTNKYVEASMNFARDGIYSFKAFGQPPAKRSEIAFLDPAYQYSTGQEVYYAISYCPDESWLVTCPWSIILTQWKNFDSSPHAVFRLTNDGSNQAYFVSSDQTTRWYFGELPLNKWTDFIFYFKWTAETSGVTRIWKNGDLVLDLNGPTLMTNGTGYMKIGMYTEIDQPRTIYMDNVRIGTSLLLDQAQTVTLLSDGFETNFDKWTDGGATDWDRDTSQKQSGSYSAHAGSADNALISDNLNTAGRKTITIEFWCRDNGIDDDDDVYLQLYNGSSYVNRVELGNSAEDTWQFYRMTITNAGTDSGWFRSDFRIKFEGSSIDSGENLWIDEVKVTVQ